MRISTAEATALDLVRYAASAGHPANVATVLSDLAEKIDPKRFVGVAKLDSSSPTFSDWAISSLAATRLADPLAEWVASQLRT